MKRLLALTSLVLLVAILAACAPAPAPEPQVVEKVVKETVVVEVPAQPVKKTVVEFWTTDNEEDRVNTYEAIAGRFMAEAACDGIKLEGGQEVVSRVKAIVAAGIPVMGHLGLTPQSVSSLGGFRLQGKSAKQAKKIVDDARALEDAGAMAILLELVPDQVCELITERAKVPIISLGSGPNASGQLLIFHDMFGLYPKFTPKMAKKYGDADKVIGDGLKQYVAEVIGKVFPEPERYFGIKDEEYQELRRLVAAEE